MKESLSIPLLYLSAGLSRIEGLVTATLAGLLLGAVVGAVIFFLRSRRNRQGVPMKPNSNVSGGPEGSSGARNADPSGSVLVGSSADGDGDKTTHELQEEVAHLRARLRELVSGMDSLKTMNRELQEKCNFLDSANQELRDLHRRKEEILAGVAHDIKNPAGAIKMLAEILQSYDLSSQDQQKFISDIAQTSTRIVRLSQDLSNIMLMEVRALPLETRLTELGPLIQRVCAVDQVLANRKQITIRTSLQENLPTVEIDETRFEEVMDNLVGNAIKYSRPDSLVTVQAKANASHVTIDVTDAGGGLSQIDLSQAFQLGRTLTPKPTGGEESTGMGLWMVRKVVEAHHGVVWVRSATGQGSTFSVMIPIRQPEKGTATDRRPTMD